MYIWEWYRNIFLPKSNENRLSTSSVTLLIKCLPCDAQSIWLPFWNEIRYFFKSIYSILFVFIRLATSLALHTVTEILLTLFRKIFTILSILRNHYIFYLLSKSFILITIMHFYLRLQVMRFSCSFLSCSSIMFFSIFYFHIAFPSCIYSFHLLIRFHLSISIICFYISA